MYGWSSLLFVCSFVRTTRPNFIGKNGSMCRTHAYRLCWIRQPQHAYASNQVPGTVAVRTKKLIKYTYISWRHQIFMGNAVPTLDTTDDTGTEYHSKRKEKKNVRKYKMSRNKNILPICGLRSCLRGRAGHTIILYGVFLVFCFFKYSCSSYTVSSTIER